MGLQGQAFTELHGKYYAQAKSGSMFIGNTAAAGVVPPVFTATAQTFGLLNPLGSGKDCVIVSLRIGLLTVGVVTDNFCWSYLPAGWGNQVSAVAPITAATVVAPIPAYVTPGGVPTNVGRFVPAAATTSATVLLRNIGVSAFMATTPAAANMFWTMGEDYDGTFVVAPGQAIFLTSTIAGVATYNYSLVWYEA
jgi:hypothetical protein